MLYLRHTPLYLALILLLAISFDPIDAKGIRFGGGGRSRSSGSSRSGGWSSARSRSSHVPIKIPEHVLHPVQIPNRSQSVSSRLFTPHYTRSSRRGGSSSSSSSIGHRTGGSSTSGHTSAGSSSSVLIHSEGGGRTRPSTTTNNQKPPPSPHQPSAPHEPINKVTTTNVQNHNPSSSSSNYPTWANPGANPNGGSSPHAPTLGSSHPSQGSIMPHNPSHQSKPGQPSVPYPPTYPGGPVSHPQSNAPLGMPMPNSYPHPNSPHNPGTPVSYPGSPPYPVNSPHGMPTPQAPHIGFNGAHQPIGFPQSHTPLGSPPNLGGYSHSPGGYSPGGYSNQPTVVHNHYHAPVGSPQNPAGSPMYGHQPMYGAAPAIGQPFVPGQTVVMLPGQQSSGGRGIGEMLKEALVFSTVNAGVNRLINGPPHHHHYDSVAAPSQGTSSTSTNTVTNTVIYNQYGNPPNPGTSQTQSVPGAPVGLPVGFPTGSQPGSLPGSPAQPVNEGTRVSGVPVTHIPHSNPSTSVASSNTSVAPQNSNATSNNNSGNQTAPVQEFQYYITNEELWALTEKLFDKDEFNGSRYIEINLQTRSTDPNVTDLCPEKLLNVKNEAYAVPTIQAIREMYGNYEFNSSIQETNKRGQEKLFIDEILNTGVMRTAMKWLAAKRYIDPEDFEWEDVLRHIWMTRVNLVTSGFERVFMAEKYPGPSVVGGHNWIYFNSQELMGRANYLSYVDKVELKNKAQLLKVNFMLDGVVRPNTTMLVGTSPELEMALYTTCYYARPNDVCSISLGGSKLNIYTHFIRHFSNDVIDLGFPFF